MSDLTGQQTVARKVKARTKNKRDVVKLLANMSLPDIISVSNTAINNKIEQLPLREEQLHYFLHLSAARALSVPEDLGFASTD